MLVQTVLVVSFVTIEEVPAVCAWSLRVFEVCANILDLFSADASPVLPSPGTAILKSNPTAQAELIFINLDTGILAFCSLAYSTPRRSSLYGIVSVTMLHHV